MFTESYQNTLFESLMSNKKNILNALPTSNMLQAILKCATVTSAFAVLQWWQAFVQKTKQNMDPFIETLFHSAPSGQKLHGMPLII